VFDLTGRVAIVTGGNGGIGLGMARGLARAGARVVVAARDEAKSKDAVKELEAFGPGARAVTTDVTDEASVRRLIRATLDTFDRLDILVNNAGWNAGVPFRDLDGLTVDIWDRIQDVNLRGPFFLARAAARHLRSHGAGRIVNVASVAGLRPAGSSIAYAVAKAGLIHLTRCLAVALAPEVTVNCVAPGLMEGTRMAKRLPAEVVESTRRLAVLQRSTAIDDVAAQVVAFCRADSVTGQVLNIDAGVHFH